MNMLLIIKSLVMLLVMVAIVIDLRCYRLPHYLTWPAAVLAIFGVGYFGDGWKFAIQGAVVGFGLLKIIQVVCRMLLKKECLGSGDCFLMLSLGAIVGPLGAYWSIVLAYLNAWVFSKVFPPNKQNGFWAFPGQWLPGDSLRAVFTGRFKRSCKMSNFSKAEKQALLECYYDKRTVYEVIEHLGNLNEISAILEDSPILKHKPYALSFFNAP